MTLIRSSRREWVGPFSAMSRASRTRDGRRLRPLLAFIAGALVFGLGYLYIGRARAALLFIGALAGFLVVVGISHIGVTPFGFYLLAVALVGFALLSAIHPSLIARAAPRAPRRWYNRWWIYVTIWAVPVAAVELAGGYGAVRATMLGFSTFETASISMSPTLAVGDCFVVDTRAYRHGLPALGDVVVVAFPDTPGVSYVRRVVALPGDVVEIRRGIVYRNAIPLSEPYVHAPEGDAPAGRDSPAVRLGIGDYFVLGDFRDVSSDSREYGPLARSLLLGRVNFVYFPFGHDDRSLGRHPPDPTSVPAGG